MTEAILQEHSKLLDVVGLYCSIEDWETETIVDFIDELYRIGIKDAEAFEERFAFSSSDRKPFEDFAWHYYYDLQDLGDELCLLKGLVVDWQATWSHYLSGRFDYFRFEGTVYFFKELWLIGSEQPSNC